MAHFSQEDQQALFTALAKEILKRVTADECPTCGRSAATHQELQAARAFLADNSITASSHNTTLHSITEKLPFKDQDLADGIAQEA